MRLGEEHLRIHREQHALRKVVGDANGDDPWIRFPRLLRIDTLEPPPDVVSAVGAKDEVAGILGCAWQRERDATDVILRCQGGVPRSRSPLEEDEAVEGPEPQDDLADDAAVRLRPEAARVR